jgi:hypothetical protein
MMAQCHADSNDADSLDAYSEQDGECCFCGRDEPGVPAGDHLNYQYFTDFQAMQADTGHVCRNCAYCMKQRSLRTGSWFVNADRFNKVSTGDLLQRFHDIAAGDYDAPFAFRITPAPIKSQHAYLWTPVAHDTSTFPVSFGKRQLSVNWGTLAQVVAAIEELRANRFRLDDIRHDQPRVNALQELGRDRYNAVNQFLQRHRGSTLFELAITISRDEDDQDDLLDTIDIPNTTG